MRIFVINVFVVAILLVGIEIAIRVTHPEITPLGTDARLVSDSVFSELPGPNPKASGTSNGATFHVDADGFWRYSVKNDAGAPSWLLIGDSVTMGMGVDPDSSYAGILARRFPRLTIRNPSLIGYSSSHYARLIEYFVTSEASRVHPIERITIFWCLNDASSGNQVAEPNQQHRRIAEPLLSKARRHAFTYQWIKASFFDRPQAYYRHDSRFYTGKSLELAVADLESIAELCFEHDYSCDIILLPYEYQLREHLLEPQQLLAERLAGLPVEIYNPAQWLLNTAGSPDDLYLYGDGIHFSERGHRLIADYVADTVMRTPAVSMASAGSGVPTLR